MSFNRHGGLADDKVARAFSCFMKVKTLLQRREVRQAPRSFKDERRHAFSAWRARRRQGRRSGQIQRLLQRREVRQAPRSFKDEYLLLLLLLLEKEEEEEEEGRHASSARRARRRQSRRSEQSPAFSSASDGEGRLHGGSAPRHWAMGDAVRGTVLLRPGASPSARAATRHAAVERGRWSRRV